MGKLTATIETLGGVVVGDGLLSNIFDVSYDDPLSMLAEFSFLIPCRDLRSKLLIVQQRAVRIYEDGEAIFLGLVEGKRRTIGADGVASFEITGRSYAGRLDQEPTRFLDIESAGAGVDDAPSRILARHTDGWSLDPVNGETTTANDLYGRFVGESILEALTAASSKLAEHWIYRPGLSGLTVDIVSVTASTIRVADPTLYYVNQVVEYDLVTSVVERNRITAITDGAGTPPNSLILAITPAAAIDDTSTVRTLGDRQIIWIGPATTASGVRAIRGGGDAVALEDNDDICLFTALDELEDGADLITGIYLYGAGDDLEHTALTIAATTYTSSGNWVISPTDNLIYRSDAEAIYGQRRVVLQFEDIAPISNTDADMQAAANMLVDVGKRYIERYVEPHKFYGLTVTKLPKRVRPGQTMWLLDYAEDAEGNVIHDIDADCILLNIATRWGNDGSRSHSLTVATTDRWPSSWEEEIAGRMRQGKIYQTHSQGGPSVDTLSYAEPFDDAKAASLPFWLGPEILQVQQVLLRFRVDPLRSTVKSVTGGASSLSTSDAESGHTHTIPGHQHTILIANSGVTYPIGFGAAGTAGGLNHGGAGADINYPTDSGSGGTTSAAGASHSHGMAHTHSSTGVYGIFEDSGATVVDDTSVATLLADTTIKINGITPTATIAAPSGGWFTLDLTADVADGDTFRPTALTHEITIQGATGKRGRITAQLQIRAIVQAVAYS